MKIFDSKHYPAIMFLLILSVLMLNLFNLGSVFEPKDNYEQGLGSNFISGFLSLDFDFNSSQNNNVSETEVFSLSGYIIYYSILVFLCLLLCLLIRFIYQR